MTDADAGLRERVWSYECPCCWASYEPEERPDDGRCAECDDTPMLREKQSEFGAGIVVCLVKFSEHLGEPRCRSIWEYSRWLKKPEGESPQAFNEEAFHRWPTLRGGATTPQEYAMHEAIHMWASAAGDHFFDLDRDRAPQPLCDLADLMIELRNSHLTDQPRLFTTADLDRVDDLWKEATLAVDRLLGTTPNWGQW